MIKSTGSWYTLCDLQTSERLEARLSGRIRLQGRRSTNPVVVGDRVDYYLESLNPQLLADRDRSRRKKARRKGRQEKNLPAETGVAGDLAVSSDSEVVGAENLAAETPKQTGVITQIHDRRNYIIRRSSNLSRESHIIAANIDQAFLVVTLAFPETSFEFIDRFLVTAEAYHVPTTLVLNKIDLYDTPELQDKRAQFLDTYTGVGYSVLEVAAASDVGVSVLRERLEGRVSLLSGNSGVGKSTLIGAVDPTLHPRIGAISDYHHRGRHTTTFSEMYALMNGGWLIDTPGIKGFGLIDLSGDEVGRYFPDFFRWAPQCGYYNCTHTHEPDCAVKAAVERGEISASRYISYMKLLEEDEKYRQ